MATITSEARQELMELVILMFNAVPGATYLNDLVNLYLYLDGDLRAVAQVLDDLPGFKGDENFPGVHPDAQTDAEFIEAFLGPLGLADDPYSVDAIQDLLDDGWAKGDIIYEAYLALNGVTDDMPAQYVNARDILANKVEVALYYSAPPPTGLGIGQTDFAILQSVLDGVTADDNTVTVALDEIDAGTRGVPGQEFTLTPVQNTIDGGNAADLINGLFGGTGATYTPGDDIDGGAGNDTLNLVATGTAASPAIKVAEVESITIQDTVGATFDAALVQASTTAGTTISFNSTVAANTSMVTNAKTAFTYGLQGQGNLTVGFTGTSGSADTAKVALSGVGTSTTARSTVNVSATNTVEKVAIAATGTNFVTLAAGSAAASVTITGTGTNDFDLTSPTATAAVVTVDASASTGANTFRIGSNLNTTDTFKGGTGADTLVVNLTTASLVSPTTSGVETLSLDFDATATVDLSNAVDLKTVTLTGSSVDQKVQNALSSVATLNVQAQAGKANDVTFSYKTGNSGDLAVNIGSAAATAASFDLDDITLTRTSSVAINSVGARDYNVADIAISGDQTAVSVSAAASSSLTWDTLTVDGGVDALGLTLGADSYVSGYNYIDGALGGATVTLGAGATARVDTEVIDEDSDIGDISVTGTGDDIGAYLIFETNGGDIGDVSASVTGNDADVQWLILASGGSIGNASMTLTGDDSSGGMTLHAGKGDDTNIGNISAMVVGEDSNFSGFAAARDGNVGDVTLTVNGDGSEGRFDIFAGLYTDDVDDDDDTDYAGGGNVGNITLNISSGGSGGVDAVASGGTIGDITANVGEDSRAFVDLFVRKAYYSGSVDGAVGDITTTLGDEAAFRSWIDIQGSGGTVGDINVDLGDESSSWMTFEVLDGEIGATTINAGNDSHVGLEFNSPFSAGNVGFSGLNVLFVQASGSDPVASGYTEVGDITATLGDDSSLGLVVSGGSGYEPALYNFGNVTATFGDGGSFSGYVAMHNLSPNLPIPPFIGDFELAEDLPPATFGDISMTFGEEGSFLLGFAEGTAAEVGDINLSMGDDSVAALAVIQGSEVEFGSITAIFGEDGTMVVAAGVSGGIATYGDVQASFGDGGTYVNFTVASGYPVNQEGLSLGSTSLTFGEDAMFQIGIEARTLSGGLQYDSVGEITVVGGDSSSHGEISFSGYSLSIDQFGGVDASQWLGSLNVDLNAVELGTSVIVGAGGSWVNGTQGADNVFLGAGMDTFVVNATNGTVDTVFTFTAGAGKDVLVVPNPNNFTAYSANTADTLASGDLTKLTDISGNQDITTASGLLAALNTGGEYAGIDTAMSSGTYTFVTSASATANTFYVFQATESDADAEFETVVLVGVVNTTTPFSSLVAANFSAGIPA